MGEHSPFDSAVDAELGAALRDALAMPFGGADVAQLAVNVRRHNQRVPWGGAVGPPLVRSQAAKAVLSVSKSQ